MKCIFKIVVFFLLILIFFNETTAQEKHSDFKVFTSFNRSIIHSTKMQSLLNDKSVTRKGGISLGGRYLSKYLYFEGSFNVENFDATKSLYSKKDSQVRLRGYEIALGLNFLPNSKKLKIYSGLGYFLYGFGNLKPVIPNSDDANLVVPFENSVTLKFPVLKIGFSTNFELPINIFADFSQPLEVNTRTFSKINIGLHLF